MSSKNKDLQPYWRPDFRDSSALPDIKVVRTDFVVNVFAVVILMIFAVFVLQREYRGWALKGRIAALEDEIRIAEPDDRINIKQSEQFRDAGQYIVELSEFYEAPFLVHELMVELAQMKQEELMFSQVSMAETVVTAKKTGSDTSAKKSTEYVIRIDGEVSEEHLVSFDVFKQALRDSEYLKVDGFETKISEDMGRKDEKSGLFPYALTIRLLPAKKSTAATTQEAKG